MIVKIKILMLTMVNCIDHNSFVKADGGIPLFSFGNYHNPVSYKVVPEGPNCVRSASDYISGFFGLFRLMA